MGNFFLRNRGKSSSYLKHCQYFIHRNLPIIVFLCMVPDVASLHFVLRTFFSPRLRLWGSVSYEAQKGGPYGAEADLSWLDRSDYATLASATAMVHRRGAKNDPIAHSAVENDPFKTAIASWLGVGKGSASHRCMGMQRSPARTLGTFGRAIHDGRSDRGSQRGLRRVMGRI